jgi:glycosyltransferase involved in cell wall biosynthesis
MSQLPRVSLLVPIRNEERYIARCLDGLAAQDYPFDRMEVLVIDGASSDRTREVVASYRDRLPGLRILENPERTVPYAMNRGIRVAQGDAIVRVDGHCVLAPDYVRRCVEVLLETHAHCVGGPMRCTGEGYWGVAIAAAMSSRFGVGNVLFRREDYRGPADTVYLGAWPRDVFGQIGLFDAELSNNQDDELAYRLRKGGGLVFLDPSIRSLYFARTSIPHLWRQYYRYGLYKVRVFQKHPFRMQARQFVPPSFVAAVCGLPVAALLHPAPLWAWSIMVAIYGLANVAAATALAHRTRWAFLPAYPLLFTVLHLSYGSGFLMGLFRFAGRWLAAEAAPPHLPATPAVFAGDPPTVSVIVPMRDEIRHIAPFLESLLQQDYPPERMEFLLVDGESVDGSREQAENAIGRFPAGSFRVLRNPQRTTPAALNLALSEARGDVVVRLDVHAVYAPDYVRQCAYHLLTSGAAQVGGPQIAEAGAWVSGAIAAALNSPFGVGGATFRYLRRRSEVDSVYLGCAWRERLVALGGWNPDAEFDEDSDLHARMRREGGVLLLVPEIRVRYHPRQDWPGLALQYFRYGLGRARTFRIYPESMRLSHLVPPAFALTFAGLLGFAVSGSRWALLAMAILAGGYALADSIAAWIAARGRAAVAVLVAATFPWMHGAWTLGLFAGMLRHGPPLRAVAQALGRLARGQREPERDPVRVPLPILRADREGVS